MTTPTPIWREARFWYRTSSDYAWMPHNHPRTVRKFCQELPDGNYLIRDTEEVVNRLDFAGWCSEYLDLGGSLSYTIKLPVYLPRSFKGRVEQLVERYNQAIGYPVDQKIWATRMFSQHIQNHLR